MVIWSVRSFRSSSSLPPLVCIRVSSSMNIASTSRWSAVRISITSRCSSAMSAPSRICGRSRRRTRAAARRGGTPDSANHPRHVGDNRWVAVVMVADQHDEDSGAYVALGDSISIDDYAGGPGRGGASLLARNFDDDFPDWRGKDLASPPWDNLATDGATRATLLDLQLPRLARHDLRPSLVTLTVGG